jgi:HD-like signal output (HDOD) protein
MPCVLSTREQTLKSLEHLPRMSPMMAQLLSKLAKRNCDVPGVASVVEKDTMLSAQVLRLANSAVFGRKAPIAQVKHAIAMVGVGTMRKFALGSSISNLFSRFKAAHEFSITRFNLHSVAVATLTELMTDELPVQFAEGAFIAGLLHDVGKLLIAVSQPKQYGEILAMHAVSDLTLIECERSILGTDHAELSGVAIRRWDMAEPVRVAAYFHHEPEKAVELEGTGSRKIGLSALVNRADAFINYLGMSVPPPGMFAGERPSLAFEGFKYSEKRLLQRFELEWQGMGDLFG